MSVPGRDSAESLAPNPADLEVTRILGSRKRPRYTYMVGGKCAPNREVYAFNSTIVNLLKAVKERVFYVKNAEGEFVSPPKPGVSPAFVFGQREMAHRPDLGCPICIEDYKLLDIGARLPCGHVFHEACIRTWVNANRPRVTCPMCRLKLKDDVLERTGAVYTERLEAIQKRLLSYCDTLRPLERDEFPLQYAGKKRIVYLRAVEALYSRGLKRKDGYTSNFTKTERTIKAGAVPRNISPRSPEYNVEVGVVIKPAEPILLDAITKMLGSKTVMKGMNASQVAGHFKRKWEKMGGDGIAVAIGLDASRFDQHVSVEALRWEHKFYVSLIRDPSLREKIATLLEWQIYNQGYGRCADGTIKYKIQGTRCSGDMNTGLGNCLIATCLLVAYCEAKSIPFEIANNGDDCVVFTRKDYYGRFSDGLDKWFREMGFNMVVEDPVYELEKVVFCQSQPVFDGNSWVMVRDPRTCIAKDCVSLKPWRNEKEYEAWISCVGMSGTALAGGIPVLDPLYRSFLRASRGAKPLTLSDPTLQGGLFWQSKGMNRRNYSISDEARYSFWRAFNINPDEQVMIENEYNSRTPYYEPVRLDWEVLPAHEHTLLD